MYPRVVDRCDRWEGQVFEIGGSEVGRNSQVDDCILGIRKTPNRCGGVREWDSGTRETNYIPSTLLELASNQHSPLHSSPNILLLLTQVMYCAREKMLHLAVHGHISMIVRSETMKFSVALSHRHPAANGVH